MSPLYCFHIKITNTCVQQKKKYIKTHNYHVYYTSVEKPILAYKEFKNMTPMPHMHVRFVSHKLHEDGNIYE